MSERQQHIDPWADKLLDVTLPDGETAWTAMEVLLDKEIPVGGKKDRRRWLLLVLLLLLLIGVCNCPGRGRWFGEVVADRDVVPLRGAPVGEKVVPERVGPSRRVAGNGEKKKGVGRGKNGVGRTDGGKNGGGSAGETGVIEGDGQVGNVGADRIAGDGMEKGADSVRKRPPLPAKDSVHKKPPPAPPKKPDEKKEKEKKKEKGFVVGVGLNQFLPVGGQQASNYNSGGISGTLGDYIPVPMVRYYFSKKVYIQLEAQFNAPQYTKRPGPRQLAGDSLSPGRVFTTSVNIQKLFYFNLPLSVHYSPFENLSLGAGLQFSRLRNAIGSFDSTITNTVLVPADSVVGKSTRSLKGDSLYHRISTNEFRVLLDVNYTYKHFILGVRYNQALSKFINVQTGAGSVTQARNSSLQFYLRYILWDGRKKKSLVPAK